MTRRAEAPRSVGRVATRHFSFADEVPMALRWGGELGPVTLAYETYGTLSARADNAILVFHALTGSQHAAGVNRHNPAAVGLWTEDCHLGWWEDFIGPGKALDTERHFVVCANYVGGCYGSTGPVSRDANGRLFGASFPRVRLADSVDAHVRLLDHLGIERLLAVIGASTGGMACLSFATLYPERVRRVVPFATGLEATPLQRSHNLEQMLAIKMDRRWAGGDYGAEEPPWQGLSLARIISHKSFVALERKANLRTPADVSPDPRWQDWHSAGVSQESYLMHQGDKFARRFDANAYLRIVDAWQHFDLLADASADDYASLFARCREHEFLVISIDSDACFPVAEQHRLVGELRSGGVRTELLEVTSDLGHDSFLLEPALYEPTLRRFFS